ncbi:hypothetical protein OGR47_08520 [Methylocystis sp. MJC1]|jgi:hypothetical protein|uniref:hypothetical protein n=1 Tax=Methylocystis sp. MJC1 TaxID=2654282 RepID=UPI0013EA2F14|nr:hypothetical protein [Methylocystis sp. MJC1]KAF2991732.1 hypothetical protein MJC1_01297 [Methylocystis sp. MJC1]MBU6527029.1 hypothetical protein [Methylocystis sp. MJC1]UZX13467.1 hypothetical protein OGR47_08520 [Methylocystis sp. MJC1]
MSSAWRKWGPPLALGLALAYGIGTDAATAQFFFRPFAYSWQYQLPPEDEDFEAPRFASRGSVARILAREGFQLVGPLGRRGDQIVATGVSRREGETRFFIDPYEGVILHAMRVAPPAAIERPPTDDNGFIPPLGGSHPVVKEIGKNRAPVDEMRGNGRALRLPQPAPEAPAAQQTQRPASGAARPALAPNAPAVAQPAPTAKPAEAQKPIEWAKPAEISKPAEPAKPTEPPQAPQAAKEALPPAQTQKPISATPPEAAKAPALAKPAPAPKPVETKAEAAKSEAARLPQPGPLAEPAKSPAAAAKAPAPRAVAARSTAASHRAIVPPEATEGPAAVTPSAPTTATAHATPSAKTPQKTP